MIPTFLRTGSAGEVADDTEAVDAMLALLRLFGKDALTVSGRYARGQHRNEVTAQDMRYALMYCARTFFDTRSEEEMKAAVQAELRAMQEEDDTDDDDADDDDADDDDADDDDADDDDADDDDADGDDADGADADGDDADGDDADGEDADDADADDADADGADADDADADANLVRHVDTIAATWHLWNPDDPVHQLVKRAIDCVES